MELDLYLTKWYVLLHSHVPLHQQFSTCGFSYSDRPNNLIVGSADSNTVQLSWPTPSSFFTNLTMMQCRNVSDSYESCLRHDVTDQTTLIVNGDDGEWLTLVVWQYRDDVLAHQVSIAPDPTAEEHLIESTSSREFKSTSAYVNVEQLAMWGRNIKLASEVLHKTYIEIYACFMQDF